MDYKQVKQTSRPYEYGEGKEFETREQAYNQVVKLEQDLKTEMVLQGIYNISKTEIIEIPNAVQLVITTNIPKLV